MNAKIILAAIAAVCCVQGIAGASLDARRLPSWNEVDVSEFADMDFEDAAEQIMMMVDQLEEETGMDLDLDVHPLKQQRAVKNVFTCATSILNAYWEVKHGVQVVVRLVHSKQQLKKDTAACAAAAAADVAKCQEDAKAADAARWAAIKADLISSGIDLALLPIATYYNCINLLA
ncbi:uncharacterized protein LOC117644452 isoform X3 [Thrips palmi]|uniref:Uncharacterized protein LOC117644452 isoform X3 n=1 Tax=Thrips palmi TaxID=161013 RepID=A0A6P8YS39_THRPL|nr:uncharacterized protein LOC117644452 isoform X3 [Thrips palmi]